MTRTVKIGEVTIGGRNGLVLIAGPCVIESRSKCMAVARKLAGIARADGIPLIFKASYDKANRTSHRSFRGPGIEKGLEILAEIRDTFDLPIITDVHAPAEAERAAGVVDILQIPAFLCRQTDLLLAAGSTGLPVNIKKGQFMAPNDMRHVAAKIESAGNRKILITERGTSFGYNDLVADMRNMPLLAALGYPVIFDATHSVQQPGAAGDRSGGRSELAPYLAAAAVAAGCDGVFAEVHPEPAKALSDGTNVLTPGGIRKLWRKLRRIDEITD